MPVQQESDAAAELLGWYDRHARRLPWRSPPGAPPMDPYRVWLSEIMLQQTTVAAVIPYFKAFTARWPTVSALAEADDAEVMTAWAGLGYYARARNLLKCARAVAARPGGRFPDTVDELIELPGIGPYTAAAIAAIAFERRVTVVDGNVERVIARIHAVATPLPQGKSEIGRLASEWTPHHRPGDYAQAIMDLGATLCTPRNPDCVHCPWSARCTALAEGRQPHFPVKAAKAAKPKRTGVAFWIERGNEVLLVRRPPRGLLGGMLAFPSSDWRADSNLQHHLAQAPADLDWKIIPQTVRHVFTHFELTLHIARGVTRGPLDGTWVQLSHVEQIGLPNVFVKVAKAMRQGSLLASEGESE